MPDDLWGPDADPNDAPRVVGSSGVGYGMFPIIPSDSVDLASRARSLYITVAGAVCAIGVDGATFTVTVPANFILPVAVSRVKSTGTTATGIFGLR